MGEWKQVRIKEAPFEIIDGDRGKNYPAQNELHSSGHCLFLNAKNVRATGFDFSELQFISEEKDKLLRRGKLKRNDTVLTTRGTVGNLAFYSDEVPFDDIRINSGMVIIRPHQNELDSKFCFYLFRALQQSQFEVFASGSAQPQLPIRDLNDIDVYIPERTEQQAVAEVLSNLDDKIDLLRRQNKTLEALAETLFRQWFLERAENGWARTSLFNVIELVGGGTPRTDVDEYWDGDIGWISAKDITPNHKKFIVETEKKITLEGLKNSSAKLLPKFSTVISARGTVGNYCILSQNMAFSQSNYGIKPKFKNCYFFSYLLVAHAVEELKSAAYGSVFDTITTDSFREHEIRIPREEQINVFEVQMAPYFEKMLSNENEIRTVIKLRDTLLPKLMSGQAQVAPV